MTALTAARAASPSSSAPTAGSGASPHPVWLRDRGMGATVVVAAIAAAFATVLVSATGLIGAMLLADPYIGGGGTTLLVVGILSFLLVGVAVYVSAVVTANTFATVVAGRTRRIALLRLIGASARSQRGEIARQGLVVGAIGAFVGLVAGTAASVVGVEVARSAFDLGEVAFQVVQPVLLLPPAVVALTTWAAAWVGSRGVLDVTPLQALSGSVEPTVAEASGRRGLRAVALVLGALGMLLLAAGVALGLVHPIGVTVSFAGGLLSFTALALGATWVMPPLLRAVGRLFGRSAAARLAMLNAVRYPQRSSRTAIGIVIGVTLVTMFAVAGETVKAVAAVAAGGEIDPYVAGILDTFTGVMIGLVAVSAVIAAVGLVNLLTLGVAQRRRELGLLRVLGLSSGQLRRMVLLEAAQLTVAAVGFGLALGTLYGWAGAQSVLGSVALPPLWTSPTFVAPALPWGALALIAAAAAVVTLAATVGPTRLATRVTPVEALAE